MIMHTALYKELANKLPVTIPSQNGSLTYTGGVQSPGWNGFYDNLMDISGQTSGTNAGNYTVTFSLKDKKQYQWENGTVTDKTVTWTIDRAIGYNVPVIDVNNYPTYNGSEQSILPYVSYSPVEYEIVGGDSSGIDAGTYFLDMQSTSNYLFPIYNNQTGEITNATSDAFSVGWRIEKANPNLTVNPTSITLDSSNTTKTITVSRSGNGAITATSSNTNIATVSVSGNIVTVNKGNSSGNATITISAASSTNYEAGSATVSVSVGRTVYVWNKYSIENSFSSTSTTSYSYTGSKTANSVYSYCSTQITLNASGTYNLAGSVVEIKRSGQSTGDVNSTQSASTYRYVAKSRNNNTVYLYSNNPSGYWHIPNDTSKTTNNVTVTINPSADYTSASISFTKYEASQSQGDFIETVSADSSSEYPSNGVSGSYWYVYSGTGVSYD